MYIIGKMPFPSKSPSKILALRRRWCAVAWPVAFETQRAVTNTINNWRSESAFGFLAVVYVQREPRRFAFAVASIDDPHEHVGVVLRGVPLRRNGIAHNQNLRTNVVADECRLVTVHANEPTGQFKEFQAMHPLHRVAVLQDADVTGRNRQVIFAATGTTEENQPAPDFRSCWQVPSERLDLSPDISLARSVGRGLFCDVVRLERTIGEPMPHLAR